MDIDVSGPKSSRRAVLAPRPRRSMLPQLRSVRANPFLNVKLVRKSPDREAVHEEVSKILSLPPITRSACISKEIVKASPSPQWLYRVCQNPIVQDKVFKSLDEVSEASTSASQASLY